MRIVVLLLFIHLILFTNKTFAQTAQDSVKQTINQLFIAMKEADGVALAACFADSAVLQTIIHNGDKITVRNEQVSDFSASIAGLQKGDADEQVAYDVVKIDSELAMVWAPYKFYWKGKFNHCGTDSFQLVRINGVWKIVYLIDTRRKEGCE